MCNVVQAMVKMPALNSAVLISSIAKASVANSTAATATDNKIRLRRLCGDQEGYDNCNFESDTEEGEGCSSMLTFVFT